MNGSRKRSRRRIAHPYCAETGGKSKPKPTEVTPFVTPHSAGASGLHWPETLSEQASAWVRASPHLLWLAKPKTTAHIKRAFRKQLPQAISTVYIGQPSISSSVCESRTSLQKTFNTRRISSDRIPFCRRLSSRCQLQSWLRTIPRGKSTRDASLRTCG